MAADDQHVLRRASAAPVMSPVDGFSIEVLPSGDDDQGSFAPGGCSLVRVRGDLDVATGAALDLVLCAAVPVDEPSRHLVVDLGAVTFLDCGGLRPLQRARSRLQSRFWLAHVPPRARRLIGLAGLDDRFAVLDGLSVITTRS